jgi:hypothetical protein
MDSQQIHINFFTKAKLFLNRFEEKKNLIKDIIKNNKSLSKTSKNDINKVIEDMSLIFKEQNDLLLNENKAKQEILKVQTDRQTTPKSFAEVLKQNNNNTFNNRKSTHVLIVYPKVEDLTSEDLKTKIKTRVNPIELKVGINRINNISKNGVIIECQTKNECEILKNEINNKFSNEIEAKIPTKKNPRVIIYNVPKDIDSEVIMNNIIEQNRHLNTAINDNDSDQNLKFKFSLKAKNPNLQHIVIETTPGIRKSIINNNYLNIQWNRCRCADFISIIRCFNCLGFGHFKKDCTAETHCSHCASTEHNHIDCKSNFKKCINCEKYNLRIKNPKQKPLDSRHDCFNNSCPTFESIKSKIIEKIDHGL